MVSEQCLTPPSRLRRTYARTSARRRVQVSSLPVPPDAVVMAVARGYALPMHMRLIPPSCYEATVAPDGTVRGVGRASCDGLTHCPERSRAQGLRHRADRLLLATLGLLAGCAAPRVAPTTECVLELPSDPCDPALRIHATRDGEAPIAVERDGFRSVSWQVRDLPEAGAGGRAHVAAQSGGFTVAGWAALDDRSFLLRDRLELAPPVLFTPSGAIVGVLGRAPGGVAISIGTLGEDVTRVVACEALGGGAHDPAPRGFDAVEVRGDVLELRSAPGAPVAHTLRRVRGRLLEQLQIAGAWVHVRARPDVGAWIDAWVALESVTHVGAVADSGCEPPDRMDGCAVTRLRTDATVHVGAPDDPRVVEVRAGTLVALVERTGAHAAIEPADGDLVPPPGARWWVAIDALDLGCGEPELDDGCPCTSTALPDP